MSNCFSYIGGGFTNKNAFNNGRSRSFHGWSCYLHCLVFFQLNRTRDGRPTLNLSQVRRDVVRIDLSIVGGWFVLYFFFKYQNAITPILRNLDQDIGLEKAFKTIRDIVG